MPGGSVYKRDIQLTKNIAPPCYGKTTRTSHDLHNTIQIQWPNTSTVNNNK
jgi:hypothetical protein